MYFDEKWHIHFRQRLVRPVEVERKWKVQHSEPGRFVWVKLRFGPGKSGSLYQFKNELSSDRMADFGVVCIEKGLLEGFYGPVAEYPWVELVVELIGGGWHLTDSRGEDYQRISRELGEEAVEKAREINAIQMVEPVLSIRLDGDEKGTQLALEKLPEEILKCWELGLAKIGLDHYRPKFKSSS